MQRRDWLRALAITGPALMMNKVCAQIPKRPIRLIVGFAPGGGSDVLARLLAPKLAALWNTQVIVENKPGVTGMIAADYVAKSAPDGLTVLLANLNTHAIAPGLFSNVPYDLHKDFTPIAYIGLTPNMLVCNPKQTVRSVADVVALCQSKPGQISFGSAGNGSIEHLAFELFKTAAQIDAIHVPYKGSGAMLIDLISGQINFSFVTMPSSAAHVDNGRLIPLAQTGMTRAKNYPNLPTMVEAGYPGYEVGFWYGLVGPKGLPASLVAEMNAGMNQVLAAPDIAERLLALGMAGGGGSPDTFRALIAADAQRWAKVIKDAGVTPNS